MCCMIKKFPSQDHPAVSMAIIAFRAFPAVNVNTGRKMIASLPSGILVQTAARTVMITPDAPSDGPYLPVATLHTQLTKLEITPADKYTAMNCS